MARCSAWAFALCLLSVGSCATATYFPLPANFKVVNNDALNGRVKNGDITRNIFIEDNYEFALVFLNTGPPSSAVDPASTFYLSIITKPGGDPSLWNTVWSANRNKPVKQNATLALESKGNLVLRDADGTLVWSTGARALYATGAQLDLTGNLQLQDKTNTTVWQSFKSPADSLLPGQALTTGNSLVSAISLISGSGINYGNGRFRLDALPGGLALFASGCATPYFIASRESQLHDFHSVQYTCKHPNNEFFDEAVGLVIVPDPSKSSPVADPSLCGKGDSHYNTVVIPLPGAIDGGTTQQFVRIDPDGGLRMYEYNINSRAYQVVGDVNAVPPAPGKC